LVLLLGVWDGEAGADFDLGAVFGSDADEGTDDAAGLGRIAGISSYGVVENGQNSLPEEILVR
jgi:hypothetical protein